MSALDDFLDAVRAEVGAAPDAAQVIPGRLVRFSANGKRGDDSGWLRFFADERGGVFGCWRTGLERTWQAAAATALTALDRQLRAREIERCRAERAAEDRERHQQASRVAEEVWTRAVPFIRHGYSDRKAIPTAGLRMHCGDGRSSPFYVTSAAGAVERLRGDLILVPLCDADQVLWSLQAIDSAGRKSFLKGGRTRGLFFLIGQSTLQVINRQSFTGDVGIVEGLATGAAVQALSKMPTFVAFSSGNLLPVAQVVRGLLPRAQIIVAGDVDRSGAGQHAAKAAAAAVNGLVSLPPFTQAEIDAGLTDWHDWTSAHRVDIDRKVG